MAQPPLLLLLLVAMVTLMRRGRRVAALSLVVACRRRCDLRWCLRQLVDYQVATDVRLYLRYVARKVLWPRYNTTRLGKIRTFHYEHKNPTETLPYYRACRSANEQRELNTSPYDNKNRVVPDKWHFGIAYCCAFSACRTFKIHRNTCPFNGICLWLPGWASTRKVKPIWLLYTTCCKWHSPDRLIEMTCLYGHHGQPTLY